MPDPRTDSGEVQLTAGPRPSRWAGVMRALAAVAVIYLFISAVNMISGGLKVIAHDEAGHAWISNLFGYVHNNPLIGLFVGLLVTSMVQSSSFTTVLVVGLVGTEGVLTLTDAIPIIMGANIGTSVTNILVSLANVRRRLEFRRSLGGAIVHDFFNVLSVLLFLPLEAAFGIISKPVHWIAGALGGTKLFSSDPTKGEWSILKKAFGLLTDLAEWFWQQVAGVSDIVAGAVIAATALLVLFFALWLLVKILKGLMQDRLSDMFSRTLFRKPSLSFVTGILTTAAVQSSSVTTSLVVPLVGAGVLKLKQIYPYTLGANIGTTVTAIMGALGTGNPEGMACAMGHLMFNLYGTAVFWPLQFIPISLAKGFAKLASRRRMVAAAYIICFFFILPIIAIIISRCW